MKTRSLIILTALTLLALALTVTCRAQTNAPNEGNILQTTFSWLSSQNTNLTFSRVSVWDAAVYQGGAQTANEIGGSYDLWRQTTNNASCLFAAVEARTRQAPGVGTPFLSQALGAELGLIKYDVKLGLYAEPVWITQPLGDSKTRGIGFEGGFFVNKKLTDNSGLGFFTGWQTGQKLPLLGVQLNIQF